VLVARGDYLKSVLGSVNYGRDADSIASMAGAVTGALGGLAAVPADLRAAVASASRIDIEEPGLVLAALALELHEQRMAAAAARAADFGALASPVSAVS